MAQTEPRTPTGDDVTVLSRNTEIRGGTLQVAHDLTVRGLVEGDVRVGGKVVVAAGARVIGTLRAREAIIAGSVEGEIHIEDTLTLRSTSVVDGSARAVRLIVEEGSSGDVSLRIGDRDFFDLLDGRRDEARAELDAVRSRMRPKPAGSTTAGDGGRTETGGGSAGVESSIVNRPDQLTGRSTDELMESDQMDEFIGEGLSDDELGEKQESPAKPSGE